MTTNAWTVATVGLSISISSSALALDEKNSGAGSGRSRHSPPANARFAPMAHLIKAVNDQAREHKNTSNSAFPLTLRY